MRIPAVSIALLVFAILAACLSIALHQQSESRIHAFEYTAYTFALAATLAAQMGY